MYRENSKRIENLITKKTPATTRVDEWISADAGVGASIASGSQTWKKNCAALIPPVKTRHIEKKVRKWKEYSPKEIKWKSKKGVLTKISDKSVVLKTTIESVNVININISLILENTKVLRAALLV